MVTAKIDNNNIPSIIGVLNTDGTTITLLKADPSMHSIDVNDDGGGSDLGGDDALSDDNKIRVLLAVSETDESTPVPLYIDTDGKLLIQTT